jgi:aspartate racemase
LPRLRRGIHGLRQAGCGAIAIPCNTVHGWYVSMAEMAALPILHIVDAAAAELRRIRVFDGPIGVIGTEATLAMRLYQNRLAGQGWDFIEPGPRRCGTSSRRRSRPSRQTAWPRPVLRWSRW